MERMAWTKEECEADALYSHEKVVGTVISVSSVEVFMTWCYSTPRHD